MAVHLKLSRLDTTIWAMHCYVAYVFTITQYYTGSLILRNVFSFTLSNWVPLTSSGTPNQRPYI